MKVKQVRALTVIALVCSLFLSIALIKLGIDKFQYTLAGGKKFATFSDWSSQVAIGVSYFLLQVLYLVWFLTSDRARLVPRFRSILGSAAPFLGIAFLSYPLGNDIYLYLHTGLMNLSNVNPFITRAKAFITELSPFVDWGQPSTYGPLSQLLFTASATLVEIHPFVAIYAFKLVCLGLHILNAYLIWQLLPIPGRGTIALAYLVNPLLLMEEVGSGHIDILLSTCAIVFMGCLLRQRYVSASVALWGGFLAKTLPLLWMPLVGLLFIRQRRWWSLLGAILLSLALVAVLSLTVFPQLAAWKSLLNPGVDGQYQSSLHSLFRSWLHLYRVLSPASMNPLFDKWLLLKFTQYTQIAFLMFYAWLALRACTKRFYTEQNLIEDLGWATLVLFLLATPWLMPWYACVLLAIAALIPQARLFGMTTLAFSLSSSAQYMLQGHEGLKAFLAIGLPVIVLICGALLDRLRMPEREASGQVTI
jgi:alpha-1,6-mannosyltransferase